MEFKTFLNRRNRGFNRLRAIDDSKFSYSAPEYEGTSESKEDYEDRLLSDFHDYFPEMSVVESLPQYYRLLAMNKGVKEWHTKWQAQNVIVSSAPKWLPSEVDDLDSWAKLRSSLDKMKIAEKAFSARIDKVAAALKSEVEKVGAERRLMIASLDPLIKINRVSVNELPLVDQLELAMIVDDSLRRKESEKKVINFQKELYSSYKQGSFSDPFK